jgi:polyhydroxybutyrate depolymerase
MMTLKKYFLFLTILASAKIFADYSPGLLVNQTLIHDNQLRHYDLYVPSSYDGSSSYPIVVDIHGFASNKTQQRYLSGFDVLSEQEDFIVAYPLGLHGEPSNPEGQNPPLGEMPHGPSFNAGGFCCGAALINETDDVGFIRAMVEAVNAKGNIDTTRAYVTGLSNGGFMSHRLACEAPDLFAAAAPFAAPIMQDLALDCAQQPIPVLTFQGLTDLRTSYEGGLFLKSAQESFEDWSQYNGCTSQIPDLNESIGANAYCETYNSCENNASVGLCSVTGVPLLNGHILYRNTDDIDLALRAWRFLEQHQLLSNTPPESSVPIHYSWTVWLLIIFSAISYKIRKLKSRNL